MMRFVVFLSLLCTITQALVPATSNHKIGASYSSSSTARFAQCDVAVFGGGFGGLYTALAIQQRQSSLGRKKPLSIVLVDPKDSFAFLPLLYDLAVGTATEAEVCPRYKDLLRGTGVQHVCASVDSVESSSSSSSGKAKLKAAGGTYLSKAAETLNFRAGVMAVGATPGALLASIPGAAEYAQPFYNQGDAKALRQLLQKLEGKTTSKPRVAIVGGGFGGVELAASVKRRLPSVVTLMSRGTPMEGTRAEPLVERALAKLGVEVENSSVEAIESLNDSGTLLRVQRRNLETNETVIDEAPWDAVLWTAGSGPAGPVPDRCNGLKISASGRLAVDKTLRCLADSEEQTSQTPLMWALGDCADIIQAGNDQPKTPKTAQAAMQQAEVVAKNVMSQLDVGEGKVAPAESFAFQDLGSMLTLGGPNGALLAPKDGALAPLLAPLLDTADGALRLADDVLSATVGRSSVVKQLGLSPDELGLSLGSHGLGVDADVAPGTLAGTVTGAARRAVYAVRMPTNQQRAVSLVSATISTAAALAKEASERRRETRNEKIDS